MSPRVPFYGFNRPGAKVSQGVIQNWWRQGMIGGAKAHYDGIKAFSETDQTEDLKAITVPTLAMQGDDDQVVPYKDASLLQAKLLKNKHSSRSIRGYPHGGCTYKCRRDQILKISSNFIENEQRKCDPARAVAFGPESGGPRGRREHGGKRGWALRGSIRPA